MPSSNVYLRYKICDHLFRSGENVTKVCISKSNEEVKGRSSSSRTRGRQGNRGGARTAGALLRIVVYHLVEEEEQRDGAAGRRREDWREEGREPESS